jgi:hypothetical protein
MTRTKCHILRSEYDGNLIKFLSQIDTTTSAKCLLWSANVSKTKIDISIQNLKKYPFNDPMQCKKFFRKVSSMVTKKVRYLLVFWILKHELIIFPIFLKNFTDGPAWTILRLSILYHIWTTHKKLIFGPSLDLRLGQLLYVHFWTYILRL